MSHKNHRRFNTEDQHHNPWEDPKCYKRGHKGAALDRRGIKVGTERANRHLRKAELAAGKDTGPKAAAKQRGWVRSRKVFK